MGSNAAYARARQTILRICRGEADARTLRLEALDVIRRAVGFDAYAWLLTDPETSVGSSPLADVPCLPQLPQLIRLKYATAVNRWTGLPSGAASLHGATGGSLSLSLMWRELLSQYQVTDVASSVYRDRFGCWGFLDLWRIGAPEFTAADIEFLGHIAAPVTAALRRGLARTFIPATGGDQMPAGPVVLLLSPALEVRAQTPLTQRYLRVLVPPDAEDQAPVPAGAYNVAAQLLAAGPPCQPWRSAPDRVLLAAINAARPGDTVFVKRHPVQPRLRQQQALQEERGHAGDYQGRRHPAARRDAHAGDTQQCDRKRR